MEEEKKEVSANAEEADLSQLLDSCLDDFNKPIPETVQPNKDAKDSATPSDGADWTEGFKQFSDAMENVMGNESEMSEFKKLVESLAQDGGPPVDDSNFAESFAESFKQLTEQAVNVPETSPEHLANLISSLGLGASSPEDPDGLPDLIPLVHNVMQKLMSKEMLYPSIKEVVEKYPGYLEKNASILKPEELENCKQQLELMKQMCTEFELESDSEDAEKKQFEKVLQLMQKLQSYGNPPKELVANTGLGRPFGDVDMQIPGMPQQCAIM